MSDTTGYTNCACCGSVIIAEPGDICEPCEPCQEAGEQVPSGTNYHCFTGHCDGSGCTYPGECEGYAVGEYEEANR